MGMTVVVVVGGMVFEELVVVVIVVAFVSLWKMVVLTTGRDELSLLEATWEEAFCEPTPVWVKFLEVTEEGHDAGLAVEALSPVVSTW